MARTVTRLIRPGGTVPGVVAHRDSVRRRIRYRSGWSYRLSGVAVGNGTVSLGVASMFFLVGIDRAGLSIAAVLSSTQIFWTTMLSTIVLKERVNPSGIAGILAMFGGITLILLKVSGCSGYPRPSQEARPLPIRRPTSRVWFSDRGP